ncbi:MAG: DUF2007 domain-containing protein [Calditrichaeota bacterium]|nr:DUF2007 domain-containing protein [Calditrichota bacterium]
MTSSQDKKNWTKIGPLPGLLYAEMISEVLKKENIPFQLTQDGVATAYGFTGTNIAGNEAFIWVPEEHEQKVKEIVEQMIDHL